MKNDVNFGTKKFILKNLSKKVCKKHVKNTRKTHEKCTKNPLNFCTKIGNKCPRHYIIQPLSATQTKSEKSVSHWEISSVWRITPLKRVFSPYGGGSRFFKWSLEGTRQRN